MYIKAMYALKRKKGLSPDEFKDHYENSHAPLIIKKIPYIKKFVRNYINSEGSDEPLFDVISEIWCKKEDFEKCNEIYAKDQAENGEIKQDEEKFLNTDNLFVFSYVVEEHETK